MERKEFLKSIAFAAAGLSVGKWKGPREIEAAPQQGSPFISLAKGSDNEAVTRRAVAKAGGLQRLVKKGSSVLIKPNIAWNRTPEQAANTHPDVVAALVKLCLEAGAGRVTVMDNTCNSAKVTYVTSGVAAAAEKAGATIAWAKDYRKCAIPGAKILKEADVLAEVLDCDLFINVPVVKVHGGTKVTLSMKNLMGVVKDRGFFHRSGIHQCIADISSFVKPGLIVLDATRMLTTNGPQGPGIVKEPHMVAAGFDPVAIDAWGTRLLGLAPLSIEHIRIAEETGLGSADPARTRIIDA